jgi:ribosomal protein L20A (L18A)
MSNVKVFRVEGEYTKDHQKYVFRKEKRATTKEAAIELVLSEITSIGLYRRQITKISVTEIKPKEIRDSLIKNLMENQ